jgi:hypothetical protein
MISATIGVTSLTLGGYASWVQYRSIWSTWWLGDATSDLVIAPLILFWISKPRLSKNLASEYPQILLPILKVQAETDTNASSRSNHFTTTVQGLRMETSGKKRLLTGRRW